MNTIHALASAAALSLAVLAAGCAVQSADGAETSSAAAVSTSDKFEGTWQATGGDAVAYYTFTFNSDHSYSAQGGCPQGGNGPSCFAVTSSQGTWKLAKSGPQLGAPGGADELVTSDQFGQQTDYFYTWDHETLSLATSYMGSATTFVKGTTPIPQPPVAGGEDAGPSVSDAAPSSADAGPSGSDAAAASCQSASDCQGLLPGSCETCSDGTTACAQWSCVSGQCAITYCGN